MRLGVFAKTFAGSDPATVLAAARDAGFACVQYNMACSGLPPMPDAVPDAVVSDIRAAVADCGVALAALSGTYNMIHPDRGQRAAGLRRLGVVIDVARAMGAPMVTLCTGTRDPDDQWRHHPDNATPDAWADLLAETAQAADLAEAAGVKLGIEPELANVVDSSAKARQLIDAIASPSLAVVLDPANLFEVLPVAAQRDLMARAVDLLADRIVMAHAKDRDAQGGFATTGQGVVDFPHFLGCLQRVGFTGDLVTHGLTATEAPGVARYLAATLAALPR